MINNLISHFYWAKTLDGDESMLKLGLIKYYLTLDHISDD